MEKTLTLIITILLVASCGVCKHCPPTTETNVRDSVVVRYKDSTRITDVVNVRDSVIFVELPKESSSSVLPTMLPSHLETSIAESDAYVDSLGLHHTLTNKDGALEAHVPVTEHEHYEEHWHEKDSTFMHDVSQTQVQIKEVEKPLSCWKQAKLDSFWGLICALFISLVWIFRKPLLGIIK
jgi:hypothetical protein